MLNITESLYSKLLGEPKSQYKILNLGGKETYIMGIKKIVKFQLEEIVVKLKNNELLSVQGAGMFLKEISSGGILISGEIKVIMIV